MNTTSLILLSLVGLCTAFAGLFVVARRMNNYGVVDIAWSYAFGAVALLCAAVGSGWGPRRWLLAALVVVWSGRLGTHLFRRVMSHHPKEDRRYRELRRRWSGNFPVRMFTFFQLQALSIVVLCLPFFLTARNPTPGFALLEWIGVALWLTAITGEAVADAQLAGFKRRAAASESVCNTRLWRYSRHPNYFFEWLIWVAYFLVSAASPWGWLGVLAPVAILYLLLRVTGIPMTEEQALRNKGAAYLQYQQTTSAFVPWFPKPLSP